MRQNLAQGLATGAAFRLAEATDWGQRVLGRTKKRPRLLPSTPTKGSMFAFTLAGLNDRRDSGIFFGWLGDTSESSEKNLFWRIVLPNVSSQNWTSKVNFRSSSRVTWHTLLWSLKATDHVETQGAELVNEAWYPWLSHSWELDSWHSPFFDRDYLVCTLRFSFLK